MRPNPSLIESVGATNVVAWDGAFWTAPQALGHIDFTRPEDRARPGIQRHETLEAARAAAALASPPPPVPASAPASGGAASRDFSLRELEARFYRYERRPDGVYNVPVDSIDEAQGVSFLCPLCYERRGAVGTHDVVCWSSSRGVPDDAHPGPGRWRLVGTSIDDLTLDAEPGKSRSVALVGGCAWHGFVTGGKAR